MASLSKIDARISAKQRELAELADTRRGLYATIDEAADKIEALEDLDAPTAEQATELKGLVASYRQDERAASKLSDDIRAIEATLTDLRAQRADREDAHRQEAGLNRGGERTTGFDSPEVRKPVQAQVLPASNAELDHDIACFVRNTYHAKMHGTGLAGICAGAIGPQFSNDRLHAAVLTTNNPSILPENYQNRLIELLRPRVVVRRMAGLRTMSLLNGNLRIPRQSGAATASYGAEMANIAVSQPSTDQIVLSAKKLTAMVVQSGEMMRRSDPASDRMILDDIIQVVARKEDATFLRADKTANPLSPAGLKWFCDNSAVAGRVITANATATLDNVTKDIGKLILALSGQDSQMLFPVFVMSPRSERFLMDLRDGNGHYAFPEMKDGMLRMYPYLTTSQIPSNLGVGTNESELYFVDAADFIVADAPTFELNVSTEAAYHDGANVQAAFSQDAVVFRTIVEHDTALRHDQSAAYLEEVKWGA